MAQQNMPVWQYFLPQLMRLLVPLKGLSCMSQLESTSTEAIEHCCVVKGCALRPRVTDQVTQCFLENLTCLLKHSAPLLKCLRGQLGILWTQEFGYTEELAAVVVILQASWENASASCLMVQSQG
jgi:hypothetical protein